MIPGFSPVPFDERRLTGLVGRVLTVFADVCEWACGHLQELAYHCRRCPECGRSRYYGSACR